MVGRDTGRGIGTPRFSRLGCSCHRFLPLDPGAGRRSRRWSTGSQPMDGPVGCPGQKTSPTPAEARRPAAVGEHARSTALGADRGGRPSSRVVPALPIALRCRGPRRRLGPAGIGPGGLAARGRRDREPGPSGSPKPSPIGAGPREPQVEMQKFPASAFFLPRPRFSALASGLGPYYPAGKTSFTSSSLMNSSSVC